MRKSSSHIDDSGLEVLVFGEEDSHEYLSAAAHVETCHICRNRLDAISGADDIDTEARTFLAEYSLDSWAGHTTAASSRWTQRPPISLDFLSPPSHPEMLGRLGRYEIERLIGSGGMGIVLKGFDTELNRPVAIKTLAQHLAHNGTARQRFARESKAAAAIVHEHVVAIHNVEAEGDVPFLVMQYVAGESLQARVDRHGPLDAKEILRIGIQAAAGLAAAHEQGVIHRDVKPANILLELGVERVLLTDFGLARTVDDASLTHTGVIAGTPHYMSPEQANGITADTRTDLFSLGAVLYFMATGHPPFRAERAMGVLNRICRDMHRPLRDVNPDIPDELSDIVDRLLEKKPSRRFAEAGDVRDSMTCVLAKLQHGRGRRRGIVAQYVRRHPVTASGTLASVAAVLVLVAVAFARTTTQTTSQSAAAKDSQNPQPAQSQPKSPTTSAPAPSNAPVETEFASFLSESAQFSAEFTALAQRLDRLEAADQGSRLTRPGIGAFQSTVQAIDSRLESLGLARSSSAAPKYDGTPIPSP